MKVVIDTNILISALISQKTRNKTAKIFLDPDIVLLFSEELLEEFNEVSRRPKFKSYSTHSQLQAFVEFLHEISEIVQVSSVINVCRDIEDNFLLALCKDGEADYLITGDGDLLSLEKFEKTKIVTLTKFFESYKGLCITLQTG